MLCLIVRAIYYDTIIHLHYLRFLFAVWQHGIGHTQTNDKVVHIICPTLFYQPRCPFRIGQTNLISLPVKDADCFLSFGIRVFFYGYPPLFPIQLSLQVTIAVFCYGCRPL